MFSVCLASFMISNVFINGTEINMMNEGSVQMSFSFGKVSTRTHNYPISKCNMIE